MERGIAPLLALDVLIRGCAEEQEINPPLDPALQEQWEFRCWRHGEFNVPIYRDLAA